MRVFRKRDAGGGVRNLDHFIVFESPPFLSAHALITSWLRSLSPAAAPILPLRSAPVLIGESAATRPKLYGTFGSQIDPLATRQRKPRKCAISDAIRLPLAHFVGPGHHGGRRDRAARCRHDFDVDPGLLIQAVFDRRNRPRSCRRWGRRPGESFSSVCARTICGAATSARRRACEQLRAREISHSSTSPWPGTPGDHFVFGGEFDERLKERRIARRSALDARIFEKIASGIFDTSDIIAMVSGSCAFV